MNKKRTIGLGILLLAVAGGLYAYREYTRTNASLRKLRPDLSITAADLITSFSRSDSIANQKFLGKVLAVKGMVKKTERDATGHYTVVLGDTASMSSVRCAMDSTASAAAAGLKRGMEAVIKGNCTGFNRDDLLGSDVILNRCVPAKEQ